MITGTGMEIVYTYESSCLVWIKCHNDFVFAVILGPRNKCFQAGPAAPKASLNVKRISLCDCFCTVHSCRWRVGV